MHTITWHKDMVKASLSHHSSKHIEYVVNIANHKCTKWKTLHTMLKSLFRLWVNGCPTRILSYWGENTQSWGWHCGGYHMPWISRCINTGYRLVLNCSSFPLYNECCNFGANTAHIEKLHGKNGAKMLCGQQTLQAPS